MCGIAGVVGSWIPGVIHAMTDALEHRGPDSYGYSYGTSWQFGVRRLSILDLRAGDQPMFSERKDKCIVFNGEIYNHSDLRNRLMELGHHFKTRCDTEVVLRAYEEWGGDCLQHLRGMYGFAIADRESVFIARDRLGIKPLYYAHLASDNLLLFASEIKALLCDPRVSASLDPQALGDMLVLGYPFGEETLLRDVRAVPPGSWLSVRQTTSGLVCARIRQKKSWVDSGSGSLPSE